MWDTYLDQAHTETLHGDFSGRSKADLLCFVPGRTKCSRVGETLQGQNVFGRIDQVGPDQIGSINIVRHEEELFPTNLRRPAEIYCCYEVGTLPDTTHRGAYQSDWRSRSLLFTICEEHLMSDWDWIRRSRHNFLYFIPRVISPCPDAIGNTQFFKYLSNNNACCAFGG